MGMSCFVLRCFSIPISSYLGYRGNLFFCSIAHIRLILISSLWRKTVSYNSFILLSLRDSDASALNSLTALLIFPLDLWGWIMWIIKCIWPFKVCPFKVSIAPKKKGKKKREKRKGCMNNKVLQYYICRTVGKCRIEIAQSVLNKYNGKASEWFFQNFETKSSLTEVDVPNTIGVELINPPKDGQVSFLWGLVNMFNGNYEEYKAVAWQDGILVSKECLNENKRSINFVNLEGIQFFKWFPLFYWIARFYILC